MNVLSDFLDRVKAQYPSTIDNEELKGLLKTISQQDKHIISLEDEVKKLKSRKKKDDANKSD